VIVSRAGSICVKIFYLGETVALRFMVVFHMVLQIIDQMQCPLDASGRLQAGKSGKKLSLRYSHSLPSTMQVSTFIDSGARAAFAR
jgi:hypothetical protein